MTQWKNDQLDKLGKAEEVQIASVGRDGTLRKPVTVWAVCHDDEHTFDPSKGVVVSGSAVPRKGT